MRPLVAFVLLFLAGPVTAAPPVTLRPVASGLASPVEVARAGAGLTSSGATRPPAKTTSIPWTAPRSSRRRASCVPWTTRTGASRRSAEACNEIDPTRACACRAAPRIALRVRGHRARSCAWRLQRRRQGGCRVEERFHGRELPVPDERRADRKSVV